MRAIYLEEAEVEANEAAIWYEEQSGGLASRFLEKWREAEKRMLEASLLNPSSKTGIRRCRFKVFPYALIYRIQSVDLVEVVAVVHSSREPGYWRSRLS